MDLGMKIYRTLDFAVAYKIIHTKGIWENITEDPTDNNFMPDVIGDTYLIIENDKKDIVGCFMLHQRLSHTWEGHINIIPKFRKEYTDKTMPVFWEWVVENMPDVLKFEVKIPSVYTNVCDFATRHGFLREGTLRNAYYKDGVMIDEYIYGITIDEIKDILGGI